MGLWFRKGDSIYIPFRDGETIYDSQLKPRMYKSIVSYERHYGIKPDVELIEYAPIIEMEWEDVTIPGQITCGGNAVWACGNCGAIYGSHQIYPTAKYCNECGARAKDRMVDK